MYMSVCVVTDKYRAGTSSTGKEEGLSLVNLPGKFIYGYFAELFMVIEMKRNQNRHRKENLRLYCPVSQSMFNSRIEQF